jgi:chromosome condensin MukBEF complex kleisin-like MukF subunit
MKRKPKARSLPKGAEKRGYFYNRPDGEHLDDNDLVFVLCVYDIRQQCRERLDRELTEEELVEACRSVDNNFDWADGVDVCCDVAFDRMKEEAREEASNG